MITGMVEPLHPAVTEPATHGTTLDLIGPDGGQVPPRPPVPSRMSAYVKKLWRDTNDVPDFRSAAIAWRNCQQALFPQWFDREDVTRGQMPQLLRNRENDRRVRINYCYRGVQQAVATLIPDDHDFNWKPIPRVGEDVNSPDPQTLRFCETIKAATKQHLDEISGQSIVKQYFQDALCFRMGVLKITYDSSFLDSPVSAIEDDKDTQQQIQRLRVLIEDKDRGVFSKSDARYQEMLDLMEMLQVDEDIASWAGIEMENVPLDCVRWSSDVKDITKIYRSPWISTDVHMTGDAIRAKYPYDLHDDGTWEGVHPNDVQVIMQGNGHRDCMNQSWETKNGPGAGTAASTAPSSEEHNRKYLVREVWSRSTGTVIVLVEGLEYPACRWVPKRQSAQWYPFRFFRFNAVQGTPYGISHVELTKDIQNRMNRKKSDEEKGRWIHLPRHFYDSLMNDQTEIAKISNADPGSMVPLNLGGEDPSKKIFTLTFDFKPECYDTEKDEQDFQQMLGFSNQSQGVTGQAKFAAEVKSADAGTAVQTGSYLTDAKRELEGLYHHIAGLLVQEISPEHAREDYGPNALFPKVYSESDGRKLMAEVYAQAHDVLDKQNLMLEANAAAAGQQLPPPDQLTQKAALDHLVQQHCLMAFGFPEPMTREALFKRLRCEVTVGMNESADQAAEAQSLEALFKAILDGATAAKAMGIKFDPTPVLKLWGTPEWNACFVQDPSAAAQELLSGLQSNPGSVPPQLAIEISQLLQPIVQQAQQQAQAQAITKSVNSQVVHGVAKQIVHGPPQMPQGGAPGPAGEPQPQSAPMTPQAVQEPAQGQPGVM